MWNIIMITGKIRDERVTIIEMEVIGLNQHLFNFLAKVLIKITVLILKKIDR